jgi:hypothetical protein
VVDLVAPALEGESTDVYSIDEEFLNDKIRGRKPVISVAKERQLGGSTIIHCQRWTRDQSSPSPRIEQKQYQNILEAPHALRKIPRQTAVLARAKSIFQATTFDIESFNIKSALGPGWRMIDLP